MPQSDAVFLFSGETIQQNRVSDTEYPGRQQLYNLIPQSNASNVGKYISSGS